MFLKDYQVNVVTELQDFFRVAKKTWTVFNKANEVLPPEMRNAFNYVQKTFETLGKEYKDNCKNGLGECYPRIVMKVPTGGGKTLLAVEAIREYQNIFAQKRTGLVVWIVPSDTIYSQTVKKLRDKANPLRQLLDQASGNRTIIIEKGQRLTTGDIEGNLVILFIMIQSISRVNAKEALKVFQDSGGFESFFPADNRFDLHEELVKKCPNIDLLSKVGPIIKTSLGNAVRLSKPFIIIDEIHKVFSNMARKTINNLNPEMVLGLTATPKREMNILVSITGLQLKDEDMVKLDMHIIPPSDRTDDDWKSMLKEIKDRRDALEKKASGYRQSTGVYIRPMALIQVEATGKDQRGKGRVHSLDVKEFLQELEINPDEIAIKTSAQNDIEDVDLFSRGCNVRYLITKEALREGWDCSFAYILGIIPNVRSNTGVTQIIGRILRQPFARKTCVPDLDESYVYYSKGGTREILDRVAIGFRKEGLEDLITSVKIQYNENVNPTKKVSIRKDLKSKYENALYLPVWVMIEKADKIRRFSYDLDIKPYIGFSSYQMNDPVLKRLQGSLSKETQERQSIIVTLDKESKFATKAEQSGSERSAGEISIEYLTRRYSEIIENPFLARKLAAAHLEYLIQGLGHAKIEENFGYITSFLCRELSDEKTKIEENLFKDYLKNREIKLAVSINPKLGYKIPDEETITVGRAQNPYNNYLFEDIELSSLNSLEKKVGDIFDKQEKILWWFRNKVTRNGYSIQGWRKYKIRPDFIAAKKNDNGNLELVYIIESKEQMLAGNSDTLYKKKVLDLMTDQNKQKRIYHTEQMDIPFGQVNESVEFYIVEQGKEDEKIRTFFN